MFHDHIAVGSILADLHKKEREEWEALLFLEELGILVLSQPIAASAVRPSDSDKGQEQLKAA
jgi:hypothetical protein